MRKLTAARMTADLPMTVPPNPRRRLTRRERLLLCRVIDHLWGCVTEPFSTPDFEMLARIQGILKPAKRRRG